MRRNNAPVNFKNSNSSKNTEKKEFNLDRIKLSVPPVSNLINNSKKYRYTNDLNPDLNLNKANSLSNQINISSQIKNIFSLEIKPKNKNINIKNKINNNNNYNNFDKNEVNNDLINQNPNNNSNNNNENIIGNNNNNNNNINNDDSDHSSMETIKKILYSTGNRKERKKNDILKNEEFREISNLNNMLFSSNTLSKKREGTLTPLNLNKNEIGSRYLKKTNMPNGNKVSNKNLFYKINKELKLNKRNGALNSMKSLKSNNYKFENNNSSANNIDIIKKNIEEKNNMNYINKISNNNFSSVKLNNNLNIDISNNNNRSSKNNKVYNNKLTYINYTSRYENKNKNILGNYIIKKNNDLLNNNENKKSTNIETDKNNDIFYLKEKIKKLTEEIKTKDLLINEYSSLAKESKGKFKQLFIQNKINIEKIKKESKREVMLYKSKLNVVEKEKQNIHNKYLENKKYVEVLEKILFENVNLINSDNNNYYNYNYNYNFNDEENRVKNFEVVIKKLMNDISRMKIEIKNINKDNQKMRDILLRYKANKHYRAISNPRRNASTIDQIKEINVNSNFFDIREIPPLNLSQKSKNIINGQFNFINKEKNEIFL